MRWRRVGPVANVGAKAGRGPARAAKGCFMPGTEQRDDAVPGGFEPRDEARGDRKAERAALIERLRLAGFGAVAGFCGWLLADALATQLAGGRLHLFLAILALVFFHGGLAMAGQARPRAALGGAAVLGLVTALLGTWASLRFDSVASWGATPRGIVALLGLGLLPLPFIIAADGRGWRDYPSLFVASWNIVVRAAAAWIFTGAVWALIWLSHTLLSLVGIEAIGRLIGDQPLLAWLVTGLALGLGLAVVTELSDLLSPALVIRLLRLLLPPLVLVVAVFVAALPLRGLSRLFGSFSAAGTLMAISVAAVTLISITADVADDCAPRSRLLRAAARVMALLLPVLAGLSCLAIWLRVAPYGLTPQRVAGIAAAAICCAYALAFAAAAALGGRGWLGWIRQANFWLGLMLIAVSALWLTPLLDPLRIAAQNQVARYADGRSEVDELPLVEMRWDWGRAGERALGELAAQPEDARTPVLKERLAAVLAAPSRRATLDQPLDPQIERDFLTALVLRPEGRMLPDWLVTALRSGDIESWQDACDRHDARGRPGCVLVLGDFLPGRPGDEALLVLRGPQNRIVQQAFVAGGGLPGRNYYALSLGAPPAGTDAAAHADALFSALLDGRFEIAPAGINALRLGSDEIVILP